MGFLDKVKRTATDLKGKAADLADEHNDKIDKGIDKAARMANEKTGGKHGDKIRKGATKAKGAVDDLAKGTEDGGGTNPGGTDPGDPPGA